MHVNRRVHMIQKPFVPGHSTASFLQSIGIENGRKVHQRHLLLLTDAGDGIKDRLSRTEGTDVFVPSLPEQLQRFTMAQLGRCNTSTPCRLGIPRISGYRLLQQRPRLLWLLLLLQLLGLSQQFRDFQRTGKTLL